MSTKTCNSSEKAQDRTKVTMTNSQATIIWGIGRFHLNRNIYSMPFIQIFAVGTVGSVKHFSARVHIDLKVIQGHDFHTNRKHVCDFLLVRHCNLGHIVHRFRYCRFSCSWPYPYSTVFPLDQIVRVEVSPNRNLKLISREITFDVFRPMRSRYLNVSEGQTTYWLLRHNRDLHLVRLK